MDMPNAFGQTSGIVSNIGTEARLALRLAPLYLTAQEEVDAYRAALQVIVNEAERADSLWETVWKRTE
jgi:hypothetical protein